MLFWALLASGQITMRKVDGWKTLAEKPVAQPLDTSPPDKLCSNSRSLRYTNSNHISDATGSYIDTVQEASERLERHRQVP
jgi:hypothetical protein